MFQGVGRVLYEVVTREPNCTSYDLLLQRYHRYQRSKISGDDAKHLMLELFYMAIWHLAQDWILQQSQRNC
jgi:hypothetical protein